MNEGSMFAPISIVTAIIFYAYFVLMTNFLDQTLGKMVFGLKVITLENTKVKLVNDYYFVNGLAALYQERSCIYILSLDFYRKNKGFMICLLIQLLFTNDHNDNGVII